MTYTVRQLRYRETPQGRPRPWPDAWVIHVPGGSWDRSRDRGIYATREAAAEALAALVADPALAL